MTSLIQTICCYIYIYIVYNVENTDNIAFTIGHVDNNNKSNATLKIYLDDKLYDTVAAIDFMIPEDTEEGTKYTIGFENYDGLGNEIPEFNTYDGVITVVNNTTPVYVKGDANSDGKVNVRDAAYIARNLAIGWGDTLPENADYNEDGKVNVRDAAAIARYLATAKS